MRRSPRAFKEREQRNEEVKDEMGGISTCLGGSIVAALTLVIGHGSLSIAITGRGSDAGLQTKGSVFGSSIWNGQRPGCEAKSRAGHETCVVVP